SYTGEDDNQPGQYPFHNTPTSLRIAPIIKPAANTIRNASCAFKLEGFSRVGLVYAGAAKNSSPIRGARVVTNNIAWAEISSVPLIVCDRLLSAMSASRAASAP